VRIAFIGLGKLGMPVAVCLSQKHVVGGYDPTYLVKRLPAEWPHRETGPDGKGEFQPHYSTALREGRIHHYDRVDYAIDGAEIIFLAVQTPHGPEYEGVTPLPDERADFDYSYLIRAVKEVCEHVTKDQTLVIISTVLPGTLRRDILPLTMGKCAVVYNPGFPAMGTVMRDFLNPEFVLLGGDDSKALEKVYDFYWDFLDVDCDCPILTMSIESAELAKVAYNAAISTKIVLANTLMEICHRVPGCNVDDVTGVLKAANRRIVSTAYMDAGMGDGGGCHPRDGIAMSWLARRLNLSYDLFGQMMEAREQQATWLASLVTNACINNTQLGKMLPIVILGKAYKPESNLTAGSPALLVANILKEWGVEFHHADPLVDGYPTITGPGPAVYLIATKHSFYASWKFDRGSVVIDPFRYVPPRDGVTVIPVGVG
jgi:UDPglucose 6-dehydrogenase